MNLGYNGPYIDMAFNANELSKRDITIPLPDGYSYKRIYIIRVVNISALFLYIDIHAGDRLTFPVVNSKSPSTLRLFIPDLSKPSEIKFLIEEFGQIPDPNYFDTIFNLISVEDGDGKRYPVIPSDQFK